MNTLTPEQGNAGKIERLRFSVETEVGSPSWHTFRTFTFGRAFSNYDGRAYKIARYLPKTCVVLTCGKCSPRLTIRSYICGPSVDASRTGLALWDFSWAFT